MESILPSRARQIIEAKASPAQLNMLPTRDDADHMQVLLHAGSLQAPSLVLDPRTAVIVDGDLSLDCGLVDTSGLDDDFSVLFVLGNLRCKNLVSTSALYVHNDLQVDEILYYNSFGECTLQVVGRITAGVFAFETQQVIKAGAISVERPMELEDDEGIEQLQPLLRPELLGPFENDFYGEFFDRLATAKSALLG